MDRQEARKLVQKELSPYAAKTYSELTDLIKNEIVYERQGPSGTQYQVEILVMWESKPNGVILVIGSISDGGWTSFAPLTESILIHPEE